MGITSGKYLGWVKGFEPLTAGATVRSSTTELHPPQSFDYTIRGPAGSGWPPLYRAPEMHRKRSLQRLVHGAAAAVVHATTRLSASSGGRRAAMTVRRKRAQLLLQLRGVALGALGFLLAEHDGFKLEAALSAKIFKNRHDHSRTTVPVYRYPLPAIMVEAG